MLSMRDIEVRPLGLTLRQVPPKQGKAENNDFDLDGSLFEKESLLKSPEEEAAAEKMEVDPKSILHPRSGPKRPEHPKHGGKYFEIL